MPAAPGNQSSSQESRGDFAGGIRRAPNLLRKPSLHQRHRVITGQRLLQAALDPFPGYLTHDNRDYDVRQFRNARASTAVCKEV
ncbi:MAG: DUF2252 family protein, partial [Thermomicrobiales bacterium]|nr:DUF2252 family protein [Thermomicrobiales bacterium]